MKTFPPHTNVFIYAPWDVEVKRMLELLEYEYIGMYGEGDPNPEGGLEGCSGAAGRVLVYRRASQTVGMVGVRLSEDGEVAMLKRMFVRHEHRGKGYSKRLLAAAEAAAIELGAKRISLETGTIQRRALGLYVHAGYTDIEPWGFYAGQGTSVFLGKDL